MIIEAIRVYRKEGQGTFYEIGGRVRYEPSSNEKDAQSLLIQQINLEPTGQIALTLSQDKVVLLGNCPYEMFARPYNDFELQKIKEAEEKRKAALPPQPPAQEAVPPVQNQMESTEVERAPAP